MILYIMPIVVVAQDNLVPETSIMYADSSAYDYCRNINSVFFADSPKTYWARMFCRPGFNKPQWCVTIYNKDSKFYVEYIEAESFIDSTESAKKRRPKSSLA